MNSAFFALLNKDGSLDRKNPWAIQNFESYDIPILYLSGSIAGMTKENKVTLRYVWNERSGTLTLKWQGNSSITQFQKRNYTAKFDTAFEVVPGWGEQEKYCFKSNFNDPSYFRNLLCAILWGKMVKSRTTANANLKSLPNGGAVDGFPVIISLNGEFHGLYTWNIPKDAWMFGMTGTGSQQAIVCADMPGDATAFKGIANFTDDFELEYSSNDASDWVLTSVNRLIGAVMDSDGTNITYGITPYLDWDSVIDYYIHTVLTKGTDAIQKNYIMATFDGTKWVFSAYDMDTVFGVTDYGAAFTTANGNPSFAYMASTHALFALVWKYMRPQLRARYKQARETIYNETQLAYLAYSFAAKIPLPVSFADVLKYNRITASSASNIEQILTYFRLRVAAADVWIEDTNGELDFPTQVDPGAPIEYTVSNALTGCTTSNNATTATEKTAYKATITAADGYTLDGATVSVKMGGVDITATAYSNGVISISSVTGHVSIIVSAVVKAKYTNQVPISTDASGNIYNGTGYKDKARLSSSGSEKTGADGEYCTAFGYVPVKGGDTIRFCAQENNGNYVNWNNANQAANYICVYDASFKFLYAGNSNGDYSTSTFVESMSRDGNISVIKLKEVSSIAYFRMSVYGDYSINGINGSTAIITVNEEIV